MINIIQTGLSACYDTYGHEVSCTDSGQDAWFKKGLPWPDPRFSKVSEGLVLDELTGLFWTCKANFFEFPLTWDDALDEIRAMNAKGFGGHNDWRLPNRRELRSILSHGHIRPALPEGHPFEDVFLGWYWTSTTAAKASAYAWYVHMEGARMFYGGKNQRYLAWPVRGKSQCVPATGQTECYDSSGIKKPCRGQGQDPESKAGVSWPEPRFSVLEDGVLDNLTDLVWYDPGRIEPGVLNWGQALDIVAAMDGDKWRLPNINELESLVDASQHTPALPEGHPFTGLNDGYWSSTTSFFEKDWAYVLYLDKGAVGVGFKQNADFFAWPVRDV